MTVLRKRTYNQTEQILASQEGLRHLRDGNLDLAELSKDSNIVGVLPGGTYIARMPAGTLLRPVGRLFAKSAVALTENVISFNVFPTAFRVGDQLLAHDQSLDPVIGTIQSIDHDAKTVTLAANAAVALVAGETVGIADARYGEVLGFTIRDQDVTSPRGTDAVSMFVGATVYRSRLPYTDTTIEGGFPELQLI